MRLFNKKSLFESIQTNLDESTKTQDFVNSVGTDTAAKRFAGISGDSMTWDQYEKYQEYLHDMRKNDTSRYEITIDYWDKNWEAKDKTFVGRSLKEIAKKFVKARDNYDFDKITDYSDNLDDLLSNSECNDMEEYLERIAKGETPEQLKLDESSKVKHKKQTFMEAFKHKKKINESVQGLARVIWGEDVTMDDNDEDYEQFSIIVNNIEEAEDEYNEGKISKKEFLDKIKIQCNEGQLNDEETEAVLDFYEKSYSDSPEDVSDEESFTMYNSDYDKRVNVWKQDGKWYDDEGNRYMGYLSKQDVKSYFKGNWSELNESIEQKYEKSNDDYNSFLRDVKQYTGSYIYLFGGKVDTEWLGYPITVKYFYYNRPYSGFGNNVVVNVLTPKGVWGGSVQEAIDNAFERDHKYRLSQKEIKEKIIKAVSELD